MRAVTLDATTMSIYTDSSQTSSPPPAFSLGDAFTHLDFVPASLDVNRRDALLANYPRTALSGRGISSADAGEFPGQYTISAGVVTAYDPSHGIYQAYQQRPSHGIYQAYQQRLGDEIRQAQAYRHRIDDLREYGAEEGIAISYASERDFWAFIGTMRSAREAGVVLTPDGNLRIVWDDDNDTDSHLAVQFLGGGQVQYVIFRRRPAARKVSRAAGTDTLRGVKRQIDAFDLGHLVYL